MLSLPLIACVYWIGAPAKPAITFSQPAMTLERLLPKLGEAAGVKMEADKSIKNEVVLVHVKDVPAKELYERIAKAACGEWEDQDGKLVLKLNLDQERAERAADWKRKLAELQAKIQKLGGQLGLGSTPRKEHFGDGDQQVFRILQMVPLDAIARLGQDDTVVFAYPAAGNQYPLPPACVPLAQEILSQSPNRQPGELAKVMIVISKPWQTNVRARLIRDDGTVIADSFLSIHDSVEQPSAGPVSLLKPDQKIAIPNDRLALVGKVGLFAQRGTFLSWSATSSEDYCSTTFAETAINPNAYSQLSAEQNDILRKPDEFEPLSIGLGDALEQLAESQEQNLIACLPDSSENQACIDLLGQSLTAKRLVQLFEGWGLEMKVGEGWFTIRPQAPSEARDLRLSRIALRSIVDQAGYQKLPSLELVSSYCGAQPLVEPRQSFEMTWLRMNCPETSKLIYRTLPDRCLFKFWGLLAPAQRVKLAAGGTISFSALTVDQKSLLIKAMPRMYYKIDPLTANQRYTQGGTPIESIANDYSEVVPPPNTLQGELVGSSSKRNVLLGISENGERSVFDFIKESQLDMSIMRDSLNFEQFVIHAPRIVFPYYQPGQRTAVKLELRIANRPTRIKALSFIHILNDNGILPNASLIKRSDLPQPYLRWLNRQLQRLEELEQKLDSMNRQEKRA